MEPASSIISALGGDTVVAAITGVHRTRVANWKRGKDVGGTGGVIPLKHISKLLDAARSKDIPLTAAQFLPLPSQSEQMSEAS